MMQEEQARARKMRQEMERRIYAGSMVELVEQYARTQPEKLCVADPEEQMTYAAFAARIEKKAEQLSALGIQRGDRVMAMASQKGDYLALQFAVHRLGAIFVPLEKNLPQERVETIREVTQAKLVLSNSRIQSERRSFSEELPKPEQKATILFTTGTTGVSKGIELSHRAEVAVAQNVFYGTEMEPDTVELIPMPVNHSYGLRHCFGLLLGGRSVVLCDGVTMAEDFFSMMERFGVNALSLTPAAVNILLHLTGERLGRYAETLHYLQLGTAGVDAAMKERLRRLLPQSRLYQYYSSTEAGCACIFDFRKDYSPRRVGKPACNSWFAVMDDNGNVIESSEKNWGYLACAGPMNMTGYYGDPALTEKTVIDGFVCSRDIGYIDQDGYLCFVGRAGDVINTGGNKVAPEEVEEAAMFFGGIRECACSGAEDPLLGQVPSLYIVPEEPEKPFDTVALSAFLAQRLEAYKQPRQIVLIRAVPRNYMGKPQRSRCYTAEKIEASQEKR